MPSLNQTFPMIMFTREYVKDHTLWPGQFTMWMPPAGFAKWQWDGINGHVFSLFAFRIGFISNPTESPHLSGTFQPEFLNVKVELY